MKAIYEIKYFEVQDHIPDRIRREQDFRREDFYRFPILRFLYINDNPDLNIRQAIKGVIFIQMNLVNNFLAGVLILAFFILPLL